MRLAVLFLTTLLIACPAVAVAQNLEDEPGLSQTPQGTTPQPPAEEPEPEPAPEPDAEEEPAQPPSASGRESLPDTGSDPRVVALAGLTLLLLGVGVRLRTIPEW